jgi:hypothetical protein
VLICPHPAEYLLEDMAKKKNPHAVALGRLGGSKGGRIRASRLTPAQRSEIARNAVLARWEKARKSKEKKNEEVAG